MTSARKTGGALTPLDRLINTCRGGLMKQRVMVARHGKKSTTRLKVEDTVFLTHVRLARCKEGHTPPRWAKTCSLAAKRRSVD